MQPPKQRFAMSQLALNSSTMNTPSQKNRAVKIFRGLKNQNAFSWMKKRAENSATIKLTTAPTISSWLEKDQVSNIQKA